MNKEFVYDDIYHLRWDVRYTRSCPEPNVIESFGRGGGCTVPVVTCNACRYARHFAFHGGTQCIFKEENK